jgi:hypothetical protein
MLKRFILATGLALLLFGPAHAADPQTFKTEESATKFCKDRQRGLVQPIIENLFRSRLSVLREDESGRIHLSGVC